MASAIPHERFDPHVRRLSPSPAHRALRWVGTRLARAAMIDAPVHRAPVVVRHDINTAPDGELVGIPGVGKILLAAMTEGRPWTSRAHFRAAIGRHVDPDVLDELERHLLIPGEARPTATIPSPTPSPAISIGPSGPA